MADAGICPRFHAAVELIGGRWTGALLQALMRGPLRYAELRAAVPEISDRMLSDRLRGLEAAGVVVRRVIPAAPVRVEYALTEKGKALQPALTAIGAWADRWVTLERRDSPSVAAGKKKARVRTRQPRRGLP